MINDQDHVDPHNPPKGAVKFNGYGHVPGITEGQTFDSLHEAGRLLVHRSNQAGIKGSRAGGAESIVVSRGYEDDEDHGDVLVYTGHGGREGMRQVRDQELTPANESLRTSRVTGRPVRVVRAINPRRSPAGRLRHDGYRYDGLYLVEEFWEARGRSGFRVYRSRLTKIADGPLDARSTAGEVSPVPPDGRAKPGRRAMTTQRIVRSTAIADWVKKANDFTCQICGTRLSVGDSAYAEAAHIRPLGAPHNGPDNADNVLCLCPNHHVMFDLGVVIITDELAIIQVGKDESATQLREVHEINREHLRYHRKHHEELCRALSLNFAGNERNEAAR